MIKALLIIISTSLLLSCGEVGDEAENLTVKAFSTIVYNAGDEGVKVLNPDGSTELKTLFKGFTEFWFTLTNRNDKSVVIVDFKLEVIKSGVVISSTEYIPLRHVPHLPSDDPPGVGDPSQKYFALLDPDADTAKPLGGQARGKLYIDGLERDEETGLFLHTVRVTFRGFVTSVTEASGEDPFTKDEGFFERVVVFTVK